MDMIAEPVEVQHPYVECRAATHGGRPVIAGTRFPVSSIVQNYRRGLSAEDILREFPHLRPAQVYDALSFYHDHREQIDREIEELTNLAEAMTEFPPTKRSDGSR